MKFVRRALGLTTLTAALLAGAGACAQQETAVYGRTVGDAPAQCKALEGDHGDIQDAPTGVMSAKQAAAAGSIPAFCRVTGYVTPNVQFELRLPDRWNGKFLEFGGAGIGDAGCAEPLRRGYACASSNMGAVDGREVQWGYNDLAVEIDFGFRAAHVTALAGKALTAQFYARRRVSPTCRAARRAAGRA